MADYDVSAVALAVPPASATVTSYRPTISVRNNGIHDALATGFVRIYRNGALIFSSEVFSGTIAPGQTRPAQAVDYWTPPGTGNYTVNGYVTCQLDQVEPNNNLAPVNITVGTEPPPPPPPVALHASQHEEGGSDELSIDGLPGKAADPQTPYEHASNHEAGGEDTLDVTGLTGLLAAPQVPTSHANERHSTAFATPTQASELAAAAAAAAVSTHDTSESAHASSTILEHTANKGTAGGYAPLAPTPEDESDPPEGSVLDAAGNPCLTTLSGAEMAANKGAVGGYAPLAPTPEEESDPPEGSVLDAAGSPCLTTLSGAEMAANKGAVGGYAPLAPTPEEESDPPEGSVLDAAGSPCLTTLSGAEMTENKGARDGYTPLDDTAIVPEDYIPNIVTDTTLHPTGTPGLESPPLSGSWGKAKRPIVAGFHGAGAIAITDQNALLLVTLWKTTRGTPTAIMSMEVPAVPLLTSGTVFWKVDVSVVIDPATGKPYISATASKPGNPGDPQQTSDIQTVVLGDELDDPFTIYLTIDHSHCTFENSTAYTQIVSRGY